MELARGSFQDENSVPSCKKYRSLAHASKNLYFFEYKKERPTKCHDEIILQCLEYYFYDIAHELESHLV